MCIIFSNICSFYEDAEAEVLVKKYNAIKIDRLASEEDEVTVSLERKKSYLYSEDLSEDDLFRILLKTTTEVDSNKVFRIRERVAQAFLHRSAISEDDKGAFSNGDSYRLCKKAYRLRRLSDGRVFVYDVKSSKTLFKDSLLYTAVHLFNNIIRKILIPILFLPFLLTWGDVFSNYKRIALGEWKRFTPVKALFAIVINLLLDLAALFSFGSKSADVLNNLSADIDRWVNGDNPEDLDYHRKNIDGNPFGFKSFGQILNRYVSPKYQPNFVLSKEADSFVEKDLGYPADSIFAHILPHQRRAFLKEMMTGDVLAKRNDNEVLEVRRGRGNQDLQVPMFFTNISKDHSHCSRSRT